MGGFEREIIYASSQQTAVKSGSWMGLYDFGTLFQTPDNLSKEQNWLLPPYIHNS